MSEKVFFDENKFWVKCFLDKKEFKVEKIFGSKRFGSKNLLSKKIGRVTPRGRMYDSPPENSRVNILLGRS